MYRWLAALSALLICSSASAETINQISYELTPIIERGALRAVQVDLRFRGEADGETALRLPQSWGGQDELWRGIESLRVVSGARMRAGAGPGQRILTHRPNAGVHVRYRVIQDWEGAPSAEHGNIYRPAIQPTYFHLIGEAVMVTPEDADNATPLRFRARMPRGWAFASDLEHGSPTLAQVWDSISVGGDFRILRAADPNVRVAIRGDWSFSDEAFAARLVEILAAQRAFWGDESSPFLVTMLDKTSPNPGGTSLGGTGLGDAFAFFSTTNVEIAPVARMLAHEGLHTWIAPQLGGMPRGENEPAAYWLSEGFTEFYTGRILVRAGLWTPAQFAEDYNATLRAYGQSPVRTAPNTQIVSGFWSNSDLQRLPYQRGRLLATLWDVQLRAQGRDFDDVVLAMRERAQSAGAATAKDILPLVARDLGLDVSADLTAYVEAGGAITLPEDIFAPCGRITTRELAVFNRGFNIEATNANGNVITGVDPALPAYAAGLRDGMTLVRRGGGEIGNSEREIAYVVRDGETERTFRYMPTGRSTFSLQHLELEPDLSGDRLAQCVAVLGGA